MKLTALSPVAASTAATAGEGAQVSIAQQAPAGARVAQAHVGPQMALVQAARAEVAAMPEVDAARVAEIKAALERGEISFDPRKLAGLIVRHHGGHE